MMKKYFSLLLFCLLSAGALPAAQTDPEQTPEQAGQPFDPWEKRVNAEGLLVLEWEDLIPDDFNPDTLFSDVASRYGIEELDDNDPRARALMAEIRQIWNHAPVVESLNGRQVRLPGLVVPLEGDGKQMSEFLLVPYYGACIHVPPPPSNQVVYVKTGANKANVEQMFDAVWVTGKLLTEHHPTDIGSTSYTLEATKVEPYE
jgi:hypothetical protein